VTRAERVKKEGAPPRRDRLRPLELLALAAGLGVFVGLVVFMGTREWTLAAIFFGVAFIVALVVLAMLALAFTSADEKLPGQDNDGPVGH
jgi:hypothetical protein